MSNPNAYVEAFLVIIVLSTCSLYEIQGFCSLDEKA